jgi:hypothetical protein
MLPFFYSRVNKKNGFLSLTDNMIHEEAANSLKRPPIQREA